jgi:predicted phosphodiesterase
MTETRDRSENPGPVQDGLQAILDGAPTVRIGRNDRLVISSDLHLGDGGRRDDFRPNADLYRTVLRDHYLRRGFTLILNGDIEELLRFTLKAVRERWAELFELFAEFAGGAGLYKIFGNHDLELSLLDDPFPADRLLEGLRLSYQGQTLLVFHGHQASPLAEKLHALTGIVLRYLANPLGIGNYTASRSSRKRFRVERRVYAFAIREKIISIIGHTHRPLFESLSKVDFLKFRIEGLCREYPQADAARREQLAGEIRLAREELESLYGKKNVDADRGSLYGRPGCWCPACSTPAPPSASGGSRRSRSRRIASPWCTGSTGGEAAGTSSGKPVHRNDWGKASTTGWCSSRTCWNTSSHASDC